MSRAIMPNSYDFRDVTCTPGECGPGQGWEEGNSDGGWGDCHDEKIGGPGGKKSVCVKAWIHENETKWDWRCTCSSTWPLQGLNCDEPTEHYVIWQSFQILIFLIMAHESRRGYNISRMMLKLSDGKLNAANISCLFGTTSVFFIGLMHFTWTTRAIPGSYNDEHFFYLQFPNACAAISMTESFMGLSLAWLDIAVKSSQMTGVKKGAYKKRKLAVKSFMWFVGGINVYLYVLGRSTLIAVLGMLSCIIITPTLYLGGTRLCAILDSQLASAKARATESNNAKDTANDTTKKKKKGFMSRFENGDLDLPGLIRQTYRIFLFCVPVFLTFMSWGALLIRVRKQTGRKDLLVDTSLVGLPAVLAMITPIHFILSFFDETNRRKLAKIKRARAQEFAGKMSGLLSKFGSTFKVSKSSKSRKTTKNSSRKSSKNSSKIHSELSENSSRNTSSATATSMSISSSKSSDVSKFSSSKLSSAHDSALSSDHSHNESEMVDSGVEESEYEEFSEYEASEIEQSGFEQRLEESSVETEVNISES